MTSAPGTVIFCNTLKNEIITFKVDADLSAVIQRLPNKSEFIRQAVMAALSNTCPLCQGTGSLTPSQKKHWDEFTQHHEIEECGDCHAIHIQCTLENHP